MRDFELISYKESNYYGGGEITVKYEGKEFTFTNDGNWKEDPKEYCEFCQLIHRYTFFMEDEYYGWDDDKKCWFMDDGMEEEDSVRVVTEQDIIDHKWSLMYDAIHNCDELNDALCDAIDKQIEEEKQAIIHKLKFGNGPIIIKTGFLTRLRDRHYDGEYYDYDMLIGERDGVWYEIEDILAIADHYAIIKRGKNFAVVYVTNDNAETDCHQDTYEEAEAYVKEQLEETA